MQCSSIRVMRRTGVHWRSFSSVDTEKGQTLIQKYALKSQTPVGMRTLIDTGTGRLLDQGPAGEAVTSSLPPGERRDLARRQIASFLRREMPVRFAHRAQELERVPFGLSEMKSIKEVKAWYEQSFEDVVAFDDDLLIQTDSGNEKFRDVLSEIYTRHQDTLVMIAKGLHEFKLSDKSKEVLKNGADLSDLRMVHDYFDRFFLSRIGIRILIGHYLELYEDQPGDYVGLICMKTSAASVARAAAEDAFYMCERHFGDAPEVEIVGRIDLTFPYIPSHLYYILFELLKNSMRAEAEHHGVGNMPGIKVVIADGEENEDVCIRISDLGGGIPRSIASKVFSYLFTTAREEFPLEMDNLEDFGRDSPLAGLGYGLGISRGYVRYFGGDLTLMSMEGYGTDVFIHLPRLAGDKEPLV